MEKISISNIIDFRRRLTAAQINLINKLRKPKPSIKDEGDYHSINLTDALL